MSHYRPKGYAGKKRPGDQRIFGMVTDSVGPRHVCKCGCPAQMEEYDDSLAGIRWKVTRCQGAPRSGPSEKVTPKCDPIKTEVATVPKLDQETIDAFRELNQSEQRQVAKRAGLKRCQVTRAVVGDVVGPGRHKAITEAVQAVARDVKWPSPPSLGCEADLKDLPEQDPLLDAPILPKAKAAEFSSVDHPGNALAQAVYGRDSIEGDWLCPDPTYVPILRDATLHIAVIQRRLENSRNGEAKLSSQLHSAEKRIESLEGENREAWGEVKRLQATLHKRESEPREAVVRSLWQHGEEITRALREARGGMNPDAFNRVIGLAVDESRKAA